MAQPHNERVLQICPAHDNNNTRREHNDKNTTTIRKHDDNTLPEGPFFGRRLVLETSMPRGSHFLLRQSLSHHFLLRTSCCALPAALADDREKSCLTLSTQCTYLTD
jgi:hypothetical protein